MRLLNELKMLNRKKYNYGIIEATRIKHVTKIFNQNVNDKMNEECMFKTFNEFPK